MKKFLFLIFTFILLISNASALKIVSLGDSITSGYLLEDSTKSFDNLLANTLNAEYYEFSYIGMRSDDLLRDLDKTEVKSNIESADIVIINIGANDLLDLLDYLDLSAIGIDIEYGTKPQIELNSKYLNNLKNYFQDFFVNSLKPMSVDAAKEFSIVFPQIINKIKEYNKDIKIYVNNLYNPFFSISVPILKLDLSSIENIADDAIKSFNETIYSGDGYTIVDTYSLLRNNEYLNVEPISFSFDPHPNIIGHSKIYELYLKEMCYKVTYEDEDYYVLKGNSLNIKPKVKNGYKFVKWDHDLNNIKSDIVLKAVYRINYLYIIIPIILIIAIIFIAKKKH